MEITKFIRACLDNDMEHVRSLKKIPFYETDEYRRNGLMIAFYYSYKDMIHHFKGFKWPNAEDIYGFDLDFYERNEGKGLIEEERMSASKKELMKIIISQDSLNIKKNRGSI